MKKSNIYFTTGLLVFALTLTAEQFIPDYPHFLRGAGLGLGLFLEILGTYLNCHDMPEWMKKKSQWVKKHVFGKVPVNGSR